MILLALATVLLVLVELRTTRSVQAVDLRAGNRGDGAQQIIVAVHDQKPVQQAEAAQGVDLDVTWIVVDPDKV
jgi:hypothetical protein